MLIDWEENKLDVVEFKNFYKNLKWTKVVRRVGSTEELWYKGEYEDEDKIVKATIRPSMRMQLTETFKNRLANGTAPKKGQKPSKTSPFVEYGSTVQVIVNEQLVETIDKVSTKLQKKKPQKVEW